MSLDSLIYVITKYTTLFLKLNGKNHALFYVWSVLDNIQIIKCFSYEADKRFFYGNNHTISSI